MILVTGATGKIGQEVVSRLVSRNIEVRALVRDPAKGARLLGPKVALAQGDLDDAEAVARALRGVDTVFLLTNANPTQELSVIDQAVRAGVKRLVKISALGASVDSPMTLARGHGQVEAKLASSPLSWTILRPGMFAQNLLTSADAVRAEGRLTGAYGEGKMAPIDVRDIADVSVAVLTEEGHAGKTYSLTGPALVSYRDMAAALSDAVGKKIEYVDVPLDTVRQGLEKVAAAGHMPAWLVDDLVKMQASVAQGRGSLVADDVARILGRPARPFSEFARDHASAFGKA